MKQALVLLLAVQSTGCLFEVAVEKVKDPTAAFRQARAEAERLQGRRGPAHEVNVLVYDRNEGELVRASVPMWLVRKAGRHVDADVELDRKLGRHLRDIEKAGLGILVEVEEEDGDQVLVWLR